MQPKYTPTQQDCNYCGRDLYIDYECIMHDEEFYCDRDCFTSEVLENSHIIDVALTDDKMYRDID